MHVIITLLAFVLTAVIGLLFSGGKLFNAVLVMLMLDIVVLIAYYRVIQKK